MHIVCITSGLTGILNASFELMRRLENAGFRVTCACPQTVGEQVKMQGFGYEQLAAVNYDPAPEVPEINSSLRKTRRLLHKWWHRKKRQQIALDNLKMGEFSEKLKSWKPDLLILDVELHEHIMTAVAEKYPVLLLSQWFSLWRREGLPPLLQDTIPGVGEAGDPDAINQAWDEIEAARLQIFLKKQFLSGETDRRSILQLYAEKIGFPKKHISQNYWPGPFTYTDLPVISITAEELEFPHAPPGFLKYVGPMVFENRKDLKADEEVEQRLNQLFSERKKKNQRLIYCSVSTFKSGDQQFLKKLITAFAERKDWLLILGLGGKIEIESLNPLPENVHAFKWIPQLKVLAKADLSINHGGIHTINECIHFKVPMLVYSGKRSDQNGCAARVHYHGLGLMADKDVDTSADILSKIDLIFKSPNYQKSINEAHKVYKNYKSKNVLENVVNEFLNKRNATHSIS